MEERTRQTETFMAEQTKIGTHTDMTRIMIQLLQDTEEVIRQSEQRGVANDLGDLLDWQGRIGLVTSKQDGGRTPGKSSTTNCDVEVTEVATVGINGPPAP